MSPAGRRHDPIQNNRFRVEIDGIQQACFREVIMPEVKIGTIEYREGIDPTQIRKLSGLTTYGNIVLKWGITDSKELYVWLEIVRQVGAPGNRKNMSIVLVDEEGNDRVRWDISEAWPVRYKISDLNAQTNEVTIEMIEITFEGFDRVS